MDPISFGFAAISMIDLAVKHGRQLHQRCLDYKHADREIREAILCIQDHWIKIEYQLLAINSLWDSLDPRFQAHQNSVMQVLQDRLARAIRVLDSVIGKPSGEEPSWSSLLAKKGKARQFKYSTSKKSSLMGVIEDLQKWQRMFDPSWFFLARMTTVPLIDEQLTEKGAAESKAISTVKHLRQAHKANDKNETSSSIFFHGAPDDEGERVALPYSCVSLGHSQGGQRVIIDRFFVDEQADIDSTTRDVRDLARILSNIDPDLFGLLPCQGVVKMMDDTKSSYIEKKEKMMMAFDFILSIPPNIGTAVPHSLRSVLLDRQNHYSLNERFDIAVSLARSIVFLHSSGFVHKNISPEHIIIIERSYNDDYGNGNANKMTFLVGFERFRFAEGHTYMRGDNIWEKDLYRHPKRQGQHPEDQYTMRHDIYSVGVCLLEIGLWTSFIHYSQDEKAEGLDTILPISEVIATKDKRRAAERVKGILVELAQAELPKIMGKTYTEIVVFCLTCLDKTDESAAEFEDEDGLTVGVRYIEKVLFEMERIVV